MFAWRREARKQPASVQQDSPAFEPAVVAVPAIEPTAKRRAGPWKQKAVRDAGVIELEIDRIAMRVGRGAVDKTMAGYTRWSSPLLIAVRQSSGMV